MFGEVRSRALDRIREGFLALDDGGTVVDCNPAARALLDEPDLVGLRTTELPPSIRRFLDRAPADERRRSEIGIDDDLRHLEAEVSPVDPGAGRLLLLSDVTDRRRAERRIESLMRNLSDVITVLDADATVRYQSPSVERILGYDPEERLGETALEWIHPEDREQASRASWQCVENPAYIPNIEYRFRHADGSWVWIEARARNLLADPAVEGVVVVSRDVSERKHREETLHRQNERLEEFASVVSHDLRNPLSTIAGRLELARETGEAEHFDAAASAVDRMDALVEDLLALARAGEVVGETSPVSLGRVAREAWGSIDAHDASIELVDDVVVEADETRLRQLLVNLLSNAIEHAGADVAIRIGGLDGGFYVEDDGPGIPTAEHDVVFTRGVSSSPEGTGFGLAIVEEIAGAHGWPVAVTESEDGGARFEFASKSSAPVD